MVITRPKQTKKVEPDFPFEARPPEHTKRVFILVRIDCCGCPVETKLRTPQNLSEEDPLYVEASKAIMQSQWKPLLRNEEPCSCWVEVDFFVHSQEEMLFLAR